MPTREQLAVGMLLVAAAVLIASPAAVGKKEATEGGLYASCELVPTGVEPRASGSVEVHRYYDTNVVIEDPWLPSHDWLSVTARRLTPGQVYSVKFGTYSLATNEADRKGSLSVSYGPCVTLWGSYPVSVVNADGDSVLEGTLAVY